MLSPHHDLFVLSGPCGPHGQSDNEILVCGDRDRESHYRLRPIDNPHDFRSNGKPVRASVEVGSGTLGVANEQKKVGGFPSNRITLTLKIPF
jgi:hypothetical protein